VTDQVAHPAPPVLSGATGSPNVLIGGFPAWRALPAAAAPALQSAKNVSDQAIQKAEAAALAAAGTPAAPAAVTAEETAKTTAAAAMSASISSAVAAASASAAMSGSVVDMHACATPLPLPPHGPGVALGGSSTVLINGLPAARMGDTILEAVGPPNRIAGGCSTVLIG
jgi:uncharacterized Zn-binding protein involved in type VI secretion